MNEELPEAPRVRISCPGCGRRRDWKPEYADTTLSCPCGATFVGNPGPSEILSNSNPYDIHAGETRAGGHKHASDRSAFDDPRFPTKRLPPRTARASHEMHSDPDDASVSRDFAIPLALLLVGLFARLGQGLSNNALGGPPRTVAMVVFCFVLVVIAWCVAMYGSMSIVGIELGEPLPALLKVAGAAIFITACVSLTASIDQEPMGMRGVVIGINVLAILAFVVVTYLFKLNLLDGLATSVFIIIAQACVVGAVMAATSPEMAKMLFFGLK